MSDASAYVGDKLLNWIKGTAMGTAPTTVYASIWDGDPDAAGVEITQASSLTRQACGFGSVSARACSNAAEINFGTISANKTALWIAIFDSATAGNQISKKLISSTSLVSGEKIFIAAGGLILSY